MTGHARQLQNYSLIAAVTIAYFVMAGFSFHFTQGVGATATIWPASGIFVSALLFTKPSQILPISCGVGIASMAANILFGVSVPTALGYTFANLVEGILISQLIIRTSEVSRIFEQLRSLGIFICAALIGAATSATIAAILSGNLNLPFLVSWFTTVCLGVLIVTPLIAVIMKYKRGDHSGIPARDAFGFLMLSIFVGIVSAVVLSYGQERFLFLPLIGVIAATYLYGSRGAAIIISLIAVIAMAQTDFSGPASGLFGLNSETLFLQFYLLSLLCATWPLSVLMTKNKRVIDQHIETNTYLKMAESTALVGHWYLNTDNTSLTWSEEVYRIHGVNPDIVNFDSKMDLDRPTSLDLYHAEDRERVRQTLLSAMEHQESFDYKARIVLPDGTIKYISSIGHPRYDGTGAFEGLFGTLQDITDQTEALEALQSARSDALRKASIAQRLAETDDLTGIANRRKIFASFRAAANLAKDQQGPLVIAVVDIDHFKLVNDRHGHQIGDKVLRRVSSIMASLLHPDDHIGRLGGEEFLIVLPHSNERNSHALIEQMRSIIAGENWAPLGIDSITVSAGSATVGLDENIESALQRADRALYKAKRDGRNLLRSAA